MPDPAEIATAAVDPRARRRQRFARAMSWLIPPIFACAAALIHFEFHVPRGPMVPRAKDTKKTKPRPPKDATKRQSWQPREQAKLDELRARWEPTPFEDEPKDDDFRRQHESLLRAVAQVAREAALEQRPTSLRVTPVCQTIRCSLELCGPTKAIAAIAEFLPKVERTDGPLWHELREVEARVDDSAAQVPKPTAEAEAEAKPPEPRTCRAWVVGFRVDGTKRNELMVAGQEPKPTVAPKPKPTVAPRDSTVPQTLEPPG